MLIVSRDEAKSAGAKFYCDGNACRAGHVGERYVSNKGCVSCALVHSKAKRENDPDAHKAANLAWREANGDRHRQNAREWSANNSERHRANAKRWDAENSEHVAARRKALYDANVAEERAAARARGALNKDARSLSNLAWRLANPEKHAANTRRWLDANPERAAALRRSRRALKRNAEGSHTGHEIKALFAAQFSKCACCDVDISEGYHADHIIPLILGGSNWISNIQLLCALCNLSKGGKHPDEWAAYRERKQVA